MNFQNHKENKIQGRQINLHEICILFQKYTLYQKCGYICYQSANSESTTQKEFMKWLNIFMFSDYFLASQSKYLSY